MEHRDGVEPTTACLQNRCSAIELPMRRSKDYLVPLQRFLLGGLTPELASALSARASWGQYLRWHLTPALDTGRFSCDQTLHKVKEQKGDLALSVRRVSALSVLGLPPVRAVLRTAVSCLCENRREAGAFQREPRSFLGNC